MQSSQSKSSVFADDSDESSDDTTPQKTTHQKFMAPSATIRPTALGTSLLKQVALDSHFIDVEKKKKEQEEQLAIARSRESKKIFDMMQINAKQRQVEYEETKHKIREQRKDAHVLHGNALVFEGETYQQQKKAELAVLTQQASAVAQDRIGLEKKHQQELDRPPNNNISIDAIHTPHHSNYDDVSREIGSTSTDSIDSIGSVDTSQQGSIKRQLRDISTISSSPASSSQPASGEGSRYEGDKQDEAVACTQPSACISVTDNDGDQIPSSSLAPSRTSRTDGSATPVDETVGDLDEESYSQHPRKKPRY